jgi:hypothetical protein
VENQGASDLSHLSKEEMQRLRRLAKSDDFRRLFIEKLLVPRLTLALRHLERVHMTRDQDMLQKGVVFAYRQLVSDCANLSGVRKPLTSQAETGVDTTQWSIEEVKDNDAETERQEDTQQFERSREAFLA